MNRLLLALGALASVALLGPAATALSHTDPVENDGSVALAAQSILGRWVAAEFAKAAARPILARSVAAGTTSYSDPSGDAGGGPDVTAVSVGDDGTVVTFAVTIANRPALQEGELVAILLDADHSSATGYKGFEYLLMHARVDGSEQDLVCPWRAELDADQCRPTIAGYSSGVATILAPTAGLGIGTALGFVVATYSAATDTEDDAPDRGSWGYAIGGGSPAAPPAPTPVPGASMFSDPIGDSVGAPDITFVTVGNDANGLVTFRVRAPGVNRSSELTIFLDTDKNATTGSSSGSEYKLAALSNSSGSSWRVSRWNGASWKDVTRSPTMSFRHIRDDCIFTVSTSDLDGATGFAFWVGSARYDSNDNVTGKDVAPDDAYDGGRWTYDLSAVIPPIRVTPVIGKPVSTPAFPAAGKRFTVTFSVTRSDTGGPLARGTMICDPSVGQRKLPHTELFKAGKARLSFTVPRNAKDTVLKVSIAIRANGQSASRVAVFRVC